MTAIDRINGVVSMEHAEKHLRSYFDSTAPPGSTSGFTGAWFERFGSSAPADVDRLTATDVLAVSLLGVTVPGQVALKWLCVHQEKIAGLLAQIPADRNIWEVDDHVLGLHGAAEELWELLRRTGRTEADADQWVTAHKICARKRPALLPVYDRDVRGLVAPEDGLWWFTAWRAMQQPELRERLTSLKAAAEVPPEITLLRVLDVVLWMEARHRNGRPCGHLS